MNQRIDDMPAGTWFRTAGTPVIFVKLAGAARRGNSCFLAVDISDGQLACPCGADCSPQLHTIEYEIVKEAGHFAISPC